MAGSTLIPRAFSALCLLCLCLCGGEGVAYAYTIPTDTLSNSPLHRSPKGEAIDLILEQVSDDEERALLAERLTELLAHPIDINSAGEEELLTLPFFDSFFVRNLLLERSKNGGRFLSIYDLKAVQGAPLELLPLLEPFIIAGNQRRDRSSSFAHSIYVGTELSLSPDADSYRGIGWGLRYEGQKGETHKWHIVAENDRGEPLYALRQGVADHLSFSYRYQGKGWSLFLGDYRVSGGQGLLFGQSLSYFSRAELNGVAPSVERRWLRPHGSFREEGFLRGVGGTMEVGHWRAALFYGREAVDARIEKGAVKTLYTGGKHRTPKEQQFRHTVWRQSGGGLLSYRNNGLELGALFQLQSYRERSSSSLLLPPAKEEQGRIRRNASLYFQYSGYHWQVNGETLLAPKRHRATTLGISYFGDYIGRVSVVARYLAPQYSASYGYADSHFSAQRNEQGLQFIWSGELGKWWQGRLFLDLFEQVEPQGKQERKRGYLLSATASYRGVSYAMQNRCRLMTLQQGGWRASLRSAHQYTLSDVLRLRGAVTFAYSSAQKATWGANLRGNYAISPALQVECGVQYFHASNGLLRADQPFLPWHYYSPSLRGVGWRATGRLAYHRQRVRLFVRGSTTLYRQPPTTVLPSLLEFSALIDL